MVERFKPAAKREFNFKRGMARPLNAGRKKGIPNRRTALIKDSALLAGADSGMPEPIYRWHNVVQKVEKIVKGKKVTTHKTVRVKTDEVMGWKQTGKGGMRGYMGWLSLNHPASYVTLLNRILPMQVNIKADVNETITHKFADVDLSTMTLDQKTALLGDMINMTKPRQKALPAPSPIQQEQVEEGEYEEVSDSFKEAAE